ncbi:MAG: FAD binding domain-containing protein [Planctomycetota bacterium]|jgi:xanthine dehydrogenase YagS FAD-binding subunit
MHSFELFLPEDIKDASMRGGPNAVFKAAGTDLLDRLKERIENPETVINLLEFKKDLAGINPQAGGFDIGSLTTLQAIAAETSLEVSAWRALRQAAETTATPQIRNRGTVGGNLLQLTRCWYLRSEAFKCLHGGRGPSCLAVDGENRYHSVMGTVDCMRVHPSNIAPALYVLGAEISTQSGEESNRFPIIELYPSLPLASETEHTLKDNEILTQIHLPAPQGGSSSAYVESREKQSFDWATTAAAALLVMDGKKILSGRICLGAVAPNPMPRDEAAELLAGQEASMELFTKVADAAFEDAVPLAQNEYKIELGKAVLRDALAQASGLR